MVVVLMMLGCTPQVKEVLVERTVTKYAVLDDKWLADCPLLPPADPVLYNKMTLQERVDFWSTLYVRQSAVNGSCDIRLTSARRYNALKRSETNILTCKEGVCK